MYGHPIKVQRHNVAAISICSSTRLLFTPCLACGQGLGLVFVAAYQRTLSLLYVDELLAAVRDSFAAEYYK